VFARLGAVPQQIAPGDIYPALERGTIDAAEFVGPYDDEKLGFYKIAKNYYYPGWWEGSAMLHLCVNLEKWNSLPKHYQSLVRQACDAANTWMLAKYDAVNAAALKRLVANGAVLKPFPVPVMDACYKATNELFAEIASKDPHFKKTLDSMNAFRREQLPWWQIAEYAFDTFMISTRKG
jgi:TRAP-type mannitol/chloroaromatic compound transport system substrate-binding protein